MDSLRAAAEKAGLNQPSLSIRQLAARYLLLEPISVRRLIKELAPEWIIFGREFNATDVKGSAKLALSNTGWWSFKGHLHDSGFWYGDNYALTVRTNFSTWSTDGKRKVYGTTETGHLNANESTDFQHDGRDPWIEENWEQIKQSGVKWNLHSDPKLSTRDVLLSGLKILLIGVTGGAAVVFIYFAAGGDVNCDWEGTSGGEEGGGGVDVVCREEW